MEIKLKDGEVRLQRTAHSHQVIGVYRKVGGSPANWDWRAELIDGVKIGDETIWRADSKKRLEAAIRTQFVSSELTGVSGYDIDKVTVTIDDEPEAADDADDADDADALVKSLRRVVGSASDNSKVIKSLEAKVASLEKQVAEVKRPIEMSINLPTGEVRKVDGVHHKKFQTVLTAVAATKGSGGVMLVGPAGSGKTTLGKQVAEGLGLDFYFQGAADSEFKLLGYRGVDGQYHTTSFRRAFENGGVFLFDEIDASTPEALIALNTGIANGRGDFPDGMIEKHPDFIAIAAGNTYGTGASRQYVGRNNLDAATLDRFITIEIEYDTDLEREMTGNDDWYYKVQAFRKAGINERIIISPRAGQYGARLLAAGMSESEVIEIVILSKCAGNTDARKRMLAAIQ